MAYLENSREVLHGFVVSHCLGTTTMPYSSPPAPEEEWLGASPREQRSVSPSALVLVAEQVSLDRGNKRVAHLTRAQRFATVFGKKQADGQSVLFQGS
jgi:hypothetical protein